jgi:hypothetical protein
VKRALVLVACPLALAACSPAPASGTVTTCADAGAQGLAYPLLVLERSDEAAGLALLSGGCLTETAPDPVLGTDQMLLDVHNGGEAPFVGVNDDGSLRSIDAAKLTIGATFSVYPDHTAPTSIPHGIYGVDKDGSGNLWVSRDDVNEVAVLAPDGSWVGSVDLSSLDPDLPHHPDMNGILVLGGRAYVALGFLTHDPDGGGIISDQARYPGMIAVFDTATRKPLGTIPLVGHNPVRKLIPIDAPNGGGTKLIVATPGRHSSVDPDDGIDLVDLATMTATQLVSETALGGSVDEVVWAGPTEAYAITLDPGVANATTVWLFDPSTFDPQKPSFVKKTPLAVAPWFGDHTQQGYVHVGLAIDGTTLAVGDHTTGSAAIRLFARPAGAALVAVPTTVEAPWALLTLGP